MALKAKSAKQYENSNVESEIPISSSALAAHRAQGRSPEQSQEHEQIHLDNLTLAFAKLLAAVGRSVGDDRCLNYVAAADALEHFARKVDELPAFRRSSEYQTYAVLIVTDDQGDDDAEKTAGSQPASEAHFQA